MNKTLLKKYFYKLPGFKWADKFTDTPEGYRIVLVAAVHLWFVVVMVAVYELTH